ncbi:GIY-YIG nuclease family protein, partial [bacterium]|nr:GIY-YIG nuclease family protein [bacterium]
ENGTESGMRFRSLQKALEINGSTVIDENDQIVLVDNISIDDLETGYIYILKSLSTDSKISNLKNLFKIGFSNFIVEKRIQNAEKDPTYLMAPVSVVATYKCFNMDPQRFERLLHRFFGESRLNIEITDKNGNNYTPKEWFIAPITIIEKAIEFIINGEIINYSYDKENKIIKENKSGK